MVTILVGKDKTPFTLHQTPLIRKSPILWADLASEPEGDDDEEPVCLLDIEARYFKVYAHWVCSSPLDIALLGYDRATLQRPQAGRDAQEASLHRKLNLVDDLLRLWNHVTFLMDAPSQNIVSDELVRWMLDRRSLSCMSLETLNFVDKNIDSGSPLHQLCIDWVDIEFTSETHMNSLAEKAPKWLVSGMLVSKMCREHGGWKEDPRRTLIKGRYHIRHYTEA